MSRFHVAERFFKSFSLDFKNAIISIVSAAFLFSASSGYAVETTSPSTSVAPYLDTHLPNLEVRSILTVDDGTIPKTGGGTTRLVGIPDGIGAIDGASLTPAEADFFYLLVNHELNSSQGVPRDHGNAGAFVSKWKIDKTTSEVVEGDDLIKNTFGWDELNSTFVPSSITFNRLCSADLPAPSAFYNSASGLGSQEYIYMNGEETFGGRAFAHVVTGAETGNSYHLAHFGYAAFENVVLSPTEQDLTVGIMLDDASNGEVYVYVGNKQSTGNEAEKAGLVGGNLYAIAVVGKPYELDTDLSLAVDTTEPFVLKLIGQPGDRPTNGAETEARGADVVTPLDPAQTFESLKMGGPEDGSWDTRPGKENTFYFATKGTASNGLNAPTRVWKLEFDDIADPAAGGVMTLMMDGPGNRLGSLDNTDFEVIGGAGKFYMQEDLGGDSRLSKIWELDVDTGELVELAQHDSQRFFDGGSAFLTTNEESSGILSLKDILGEGWFAASIQVHTSAGLSNTAELVENGQLVLMNIANRGNDLRREQVVANGDFWDYRVDGIDPGANWNTSGFLIDANWNVDTNGITTGPAATMLGYGESAGTFVTDLGQPAEPRPAAYYFRHEFDLAAPADVILMDLYMKIDDGAVVYLNGTEVARYNMNLDLMVDNNTFASNNESSERDWKQIRVNGESVNLLPSGNVLAVSLHQENAGSSDLRLDVEMYAWLDSLDAGTPPATPTGLAVSNATQTQLEVTWDATGDAKFFRIERQQAGDVTWEVIESEYPGDFNSYIDDNVQAGATYNYRIWAVNVHGRSDLSATASGSTMTSLLPIIFEENFEETDSFGIFSVVDVAGPDRGFDWVVWDFGSTGAVQGNGFGGASATEDWLILTNPVNFLFYTDEQLTYDSQISFSGPAPQLLYSVDYDPASMSDPNLATWELIFEDTTLNNTLTPVGPFDLSAIPDTAYLAYQYESLGGAGGQSVRFTIDDVVLEGSCGFDFEGAENTDIAQDVDSPWTVVNIGSAFGWVYDTQVERQGAINNNFGSGPGGIDNTLEADDYLISPPLTLGDVASVLKFDYYERFGDTISNPLTVLITDAYTGDPTTTAWTDITPANLDGSSNDEWIPAASGSFTLPGNDVRVAFRYQASGVGGGSTKRIGVDTICVEALGGPLEAGFNFNRNGGVVTFTPAVSGGTPPYSFSWDFGDGGTSTEVAPVYEYTTPGTYSVTLTVIDTDGTTVVATQTDIITVTEFTVPAPQDLRIAAFNVSMNRPTSGGLAAALSTPGDTQIQAVAEVIQRANPDILLLNEFDQIYDANGNFDEQATMASIDNFLANYLAIPQAADVSSVDYQYTYVAPSNTGVPSGLDFNNDGSVGGGNDAYGFGEFPGQFAMIFLSKYPIEGNDVRTFQNFLWKDMPGALLPPDPNDSDNDGNTASYYNAAELDVFRLSSKTHWDIPVMVDGIGTVHVLASHPTPPVFDDGTATTYPSAVVVDQNGLRNHDEIRFWADYINPAQSGYIYDDVEWQQAGNTTPANPSGGLAANARFIVMGDQNADPTDGDATFNPILLLLDDAGVDTSLTPSSAGALEQVPSGSFRETKTASFNLRADYALPSVTGWTLDQAWVFWPLTTDLEADLLSGSDHRMVVVDMVGDMNVDTDGDGVLDNVDNCTNVINPGQIDSNGDGFGNACDADTNNDCVINFLDVAAFSSVFLTNDADNDFDSSGSVNFLDYVLLSGNFLGQPGPSALASCNN